MSPLATIDFDPSAAQDDFRGMVLAQGAQTSMFCGGIGSGKSAIGAVIAFELAAYYALGLRGMIVSPSYRSFAQTTLVEIRRWWPGEGTLWRWGRKDNYPCLTLKSGGKESDIFVRSAQDHVTAEEIRGPTIHWAWGDEACVWGAGSYAYDLVLGRLRENNGARFPLLYLTSSPRWGWVTRAFNIVGKLPPTAWERGLYLRGTKPEDAVYLRSSRTEENTHNAANYSATMRTRYEDRFAQQELDGDFIAPTEAVYPQFYRSIHVIPQHKAMEMFRACRYRVGGVDWGFGDPAALVAVGIDHDGRYIIVREWSEPGKTEAQLGAIASRWSQELGITTWYAPPDRKQGIALWRGDVAGSVPVAANVSKARNDVESGLEAVRNAMRLSSSVVHPCGGGLPASWFYMGDDCGALADDLEQYKHAPPTTDGHVREDRFRGSDHRPDAVRYAILSAQYALSTTTEVRY